jgi:outer membrane protein assembly factor BamB
MNDIARRLIPLLLLARAVSAQSGNTGQLEGDSLWRQALGGVVTGTPTVQAQSVVVALDSGAIKAYSSAGRPLWTYSARGRISPFVSRSREGTSYISRTNGACIAVNRVGRELWRCNPGGPLSGPVVSGWDGRLYIPTGKKITCCTAAGSLLWSYAFDERIALGPRLDQNGGVLLALENGEIFRFDPFGRAASWRFPSPPAVLLSVSAGGKPAGGGAVAPNAAALRIMALHGDGRVELLNPAKPGEAPRALPKLPAPPLAAESIGGRAAITLRNGQVLLVSADNGAILWTADSHIRLQGAVESEAAMLYDERGVYVLTKNGATGLNADGRRLWFTTLRNASGLPAFGDDGVLYSGGTDWILYAWKVEDRSLPLKQSVYGPAPEGSYGTGSPPPSPWAGDILRFEENELKGQLETIRRGIQAGRVGERELAWTAYLMETVAADYNRPGASAFRPSALIQYRVQALQLLARIGSRETMPFLADVFRREKEPLLKAAAAGAIGAIGADPDGVALQAFIDAVATGNPLRDEPTLVAIAAATGRLCRFSGPPLSDAGARILALLSGATQPQAVQRQALHEMSTLSPLVLRHF